MRHIWVKVDPWDKKLVTAALEGGAEGIMVPPGYSEKVKELGRVETIAEDGDIKPEQDVIVYKITSGADEDEIVRICKTRKVILECSDWSIIPMENLIAKGADVIAQVRTLQEAQTAFGILEKGVRHILIHPDDAASLKKMLSVLRTQEEQTPLDEAEVISVEPAGMGDRVCVDTCTSMVQGQGMLIGNSSSAMFLVHSESVSNPYVAPRPFRVNAGPVHAYIRVPGGKTRYLSELCAGDQVQITDYTGSTTAATVGRVKVEKRPLIMVVAAYGGRRITSILQNAETIRLTGADGKPKSVVHLKPGDKVLVACEECGRHFGIKIDETITEK